MEKSLNIKGILNSRVMKNGIWLYTLQIFNTIIPFLTIPYITRILGTEQYGAFSLSLNLITYFQVVVEYGFDLSGSRKVAMAENKDQIRKIYSNIIVSKIILCVITFITMIIILNVYTGREYDGIYIFALYIIVIGTAFQQTWLFQGLQQMKYITILNVISRTVSLVLIFLFIKSNDDLLLYCIFYSITFLFSGIFSIIVVTKKLKIKFEFPSIKDIKNELKDGWYIFTTNAMSKLFSAFGITILGIMGTQAEVGIYSALQKIPVVILMLYTPIGQVIYPYISGIYRESFDKGKNIVKKIIIILVTLMTITAIFVIIFSRQIVYLLFGNQYIDYYVILIPFSIWIIFSVLNNLLGVQILTASGYGKQYSKSFNISVIFLIIFSIILGAKFSIYGIAIANVIAEIILTIILLYYGSKLKSAIY